MRSTRATGRGLVAFRLPSSSLRLCEAPLLSTFRGADSAQADECGHAPFSSESTERDKEKDREEQQTEQEKKEEDHTLRRGGHMRRGWSRDLCLPSQGPWCYMLGLSIKKDVY